MRLRRSGVVRGMSGISRAEGFSRSPALLREDAVTEAGRIVGPGSILWVVRDARAALPDTLANIMGTYVYGRLRILLRCRETHCERSVAVFGFAGRMFWGCSEGSKILVSDALADASVATAKSWRMWGRS